MGEKRVVKKNQDYLNLVDVFRFDISCTIKETGFFIDGH